MTESIDTLRRGEDSIGAQRRSIFQFRFKALLAVQTTTPMLLRGRIGPKLFHHLEAVHLRHHNIEHETCSRMEPLCSS